MANANCTKGALGRVASGQFPWSLSGWLHTLSRDPHFDFVPLSTDTPIWLLTPKKATVDMELFLRPFTALAWLGILGFCAAVWMIESLLLSFDMGSVSTRQILSITAWSFFLLVNSFYGGALTMFFTTSDPIPFQTVQEVIQAYPEWKLILRQGKENVNYSTE